MKPKNKTIAMLKAYAQEAGKTQEQIAQDIGVSLATIHRWFNGRHMRIHRITEKAVAEYLRHNLEAQNENANRPAQTNLGSPDAQRV